MTVKHEENGKKGRFFINSENKPLAEMTYVYAGPHKIIIDHTEVDESLKGQGIGYSLVEEAIKLARQQDLKIMPLCPFAAAVFKKKEEQYKDILV